MSKGTQRILWAIALALLCAVMALVNRPTETVSSTANAEAGFEVGQRLPDFSIAQMDGEEFSLADHRGQVVLLNLWATWCGPCIAELPSFEAIQREFSDAVCVLAIHSNVITDDIAARVEEMGLDIRFAIDESGEIGQLLGGATMLPRTIVLDANGIVAYNQAGSITLELLRELAEDELR